MNVLSLDDLILCADQEVQISLKMAEQGIAIRNNETSKILTITKEKIREMELYRGTKKYNLRITSQDSVFNIRNIPESQIGNIEKLASEWYSISVYIKELEVSRPHDGIIGITNNYLELRTDKTVFDIDLNEIDGITEIGDEILINFKEGSGGIIEMSVNNSGTILRDISERCTKLKSNAIATFEQIQSLYPRGKNTFIFYLNYLKMIGRTFEHQIYYSSIQKIWFLENKKNEEFKKNLVFKIDPPFKQGQTRYEYVVLEFENYEEDVDINFDDEIKEKCPELKLQYTEMIGDNFAEVLMAISKLKVKKQGEFTTTDGQQRIKCHTKAFEGYIYPLEDSLLFLNKVIYMKHSDIRVVEFSRITLSLDFGKTFDMKIITFENQYLFNSLPKEEFGPLERYFAKHNIQIRSEVYANEPDEDDYETSEEYEDEYEEDTATASELEEVSE